MIVLEVYTNTGLSPCTSSGKDVGVDVGFDSGSAVVVVVEIVLSI